MNISGVIIHVRPEQAATMKQRLCERKGVEVHAVTQDGRLIVTVEEEGERAMADAVVGLQNLPGVLSASLVYHQFEEDAALDEVIELSEQEAQA
ncbi:MAG TPA: chaperone NapD [Thiohalobacter sp.]|nr:chaperone NapD [Thiohalobacter sp.]